MYSINYSYSYSNICTKVVLDVQTGCFLKSGFYIFCGCLPVRIDLTFLSLSLILTAHGLQQFACTGSGFTETPIEIREIGQEVGML